MKDQSKAHPAPVLWREIGTEIALDFDRIVLTSEPETFGQPTNVGVDRETGGMKRDGQHPICGLSSHTRQRHEIFHPVWNLAIETVNDVSCHAHETLRFRPEKTSRSDDRLEFFRIRLGKRIDVGVFRKQPRSDGVHPYIGALGREDRGGQQLIGGIVMERAELVG
jgi:hypothetical protein